ncbi:MAG: hypothetical protein JOZ99_03565 [Actinobacteria bacterium]|nr:hypothetical protein [Actinomycetota bacterium]
MERRDEAFDDTVLRASGALFLFGIALIHFLDFFSKLAETPYVAALYGLLMAVTVGAGLALVLSGARAAWYVGGLAAALTIVAYVMSRTTGLPNSTGDIGNWHEPLGQAALFVEGAVVVLSTTALAIDLRARARMPRSVDSQIGESRPRRSVTA